MEVIGIESFSKSPTTAIEVEFSINYLDAFGYSIDI
jgi:hypothetical protein